MADSPTSSSKIGTNAPNVIDLQGVSESWVEEKIKLAKEEVIKKIDGTIREQVQWDKASLITVFGIFASVISFLTIEFQFLKTVCSIEKILGFTLVLFSLLFSFNVALDYLVKSRLDKKAPKPNLYFVILVIILFIIGIFFTYRGNEELCKDNKIYQRYSDQFESNFNLDVKDIQRKLNNQNSRINNLDNQIKTIKK